MNELNRDLRSGAFSTLLGILILALLACVPLEGSDPVRASSLGVHRLCRTSSKKSVNPLKFPVKYRARTHFLKLVCVAKDVKDSQGFL